MRRLSSFLVLAVLVLSVFLLASSAAEAASFRSHVARVPDIPTSQQSVRIWMNSDTAFGETAGLEYNVGSSYIKVLATYDASGYGGANWRADIPAQPNGTTVRYQLFTRNQSNSDYGHTGFNWSYTVHDGDIQWNGLRHDTFDSYYRSPFGAVAAGTSVTLRFRTIPLDVDGVSVRVYQYNPATDTTAAATDYPMTYLQDRVENGTTYAIWSYTLSTPASPAILYYKFKVTDRLDVDWYSDSYADDHDNLGQGGEGVTSDDEPFPSFQLTVYDPAFQTPTWLQNASVYQIFPDRFRNGDPTNDYCVGSGAACPTFYGSESVVAHTTWNEAIHDPRQAGPYFNAYGNQFYGGDLRGVIQKLDYLQGLGIDTLYFTPIFQGRSNHRYDTDNYLVIDPALGTEADFAELAQELQRRGMYMILDGVFNHTSSDSVYFDRYNRYAALEGACEALASSFRSWFVFHNNNVPCGSADYEGWFGYASLAVLQDGSAAVRDFIYRTNAENVIKHWYVRGNNGWRFDVADEITHNWWRDFRPYAKSYDANGPLVGEVWYDATKFLLGDQLDSVMNYRFRKNVLGFARGAGWRDNDSNGSNEIVGLTPSQFDRALRSVREDYPPQATNAMFNLLDSHDTNRALYVLTLVGDSGLSQAKERLKLAALFQFTYPGAPMVYYGDEAALNSPSLANGSNGPEDDPYNRAPYPWADASGNTSIYGPADSGMIAFYSTLGHLRKEHAALRTGSFTTLLTGDTTASGTDNSSYAFARVSGGDKAVVVLNNGATANTVTVPVSAYFANGTTLQDALSGASYTVSGGNVTLPVAARSGAILLAGTASADSTPPTASATRSPSANGAGWNNSSPVTVNLGGSDTGSGVKELRYWVNNGPVTVVAGSTASLPVSVSGTVVSVRAIDQAGNGSAVATLTVRIDTVAPDTTVDAAPPALSNSSSASFAVSSNEATVTFECKLDSGAFAACTPPVSYNALGEGSHTFSVRAIDQAGNVDASPATSSWTVDTIAPESTLVGGPASLTALTGATFTFGSNEAGSTFQCSLDGGALLTCTSPASYSGLADGSHTFQVVATDATGNSDASPASYAWTVDSVAPVASVDSAPPALSNSGSATFAFSSSESGSSFACSVDSAPFAPCTSPISVADLADGGHTFAVQATDGAGNASAPASYNWTVDSTPGDTVIDSAPAALTNSASATFAFSAEAGSTFECALDGAAFVPCSSPALYSDLADGEHSFQVRATDTANNVDPTPATYGWSVDSTAPESTIGEKPVAVSNSASATFSFESNEAASFACSLDGAPAVPCTSPVSYNLLGEGSHTFTVAATDLAGNVDGSAASATWVVDTIAPASTITAHPTAPSKSSSATFSFESNEVGSSFECRLDDATFAPCSGSASYNDLADGSHTFEVQATDAAGNTETSAASYTWTVDSTAPDTTLTDAPATLSNSASAAFAFLSSEEGGSFACKLDDAAFAPCTSPTSYSALGEGSHTFQVVATDAAGNPDPSPASHGWTVDTVAPETTIAGQPASLSNSGSASFSFTSSEEGSSFACSLDGASFAACTAPLSYSDLPDGGHTFQVVATDAVGNSDPTPASYNWTIDTQPGDTMIDSAPPVLSSSASATFAFSAEPGSMFQCQLDGGSFAVCTSPKSYSGLADGAHTFAVRAIDIAGNVDPTPASHVWAIDTTLPTVSIAGRPAALSNSASATFTFASNESGSFACSLDGGAFAPCTSPATYNALSEGNHSFAVRATDAAGNVGLAASASWVVDTVAPVVTISSGPTSPTSQTSATFVFASSEAGSSAVCKVDSGAFAPCSSPVTYNGLAVGNHSFTVQGTDGAGNSGATVSYAWTVVVAYQFTGFYQPISNLPALNSVKGGSSVPVKFSLGGNQGLDVFAVGYPRSQVIACGSTTPVDGGEATNTSGSSGLTYDAASNTYSYVWKTEKGWANSCRQLIVRFNDGTLYRANFSFK